MGGQEDVVFGAWNAKCGEFRVVLRDRSAGIVGEEVTPHALGLAPFEEVKRPRDQLATEVDGAVEIEKHGFHAVEARGHVGHALSFADGLISLPTLMHTQEPLDAGFSFTGCVDSLRACRGMTNSTSAADSLIALTHHRGT